MALCPTNEIMKSLLLMDNGVLVMAGGCPQETDEKSALIVLILLMRLLSMVVIVKRMKDDEFRGEIAVNLKTGEKKALQSFKMTAVAMAGIGHPLLVFLIPCKIKELG